MKKIFLAAVLASALTLPSCLGPDRLYNSVKNWNAELSPDDWVEEVVFLGFHIIPVYGIAWLVDVVAINTIGYWSGDYPVNDPGPFPGFQKKD
jgi:hypothetical protein